MSSAVGALAGRTDGDAHRPRPLGEPPVGARTGSRSQARRVLLGEDLLA